MTDNQSRHLEFLGKLLEVLFPNRVSANPAPDRLRRREELRREGPVPLLMFGGGSCHQRRLAIEARKASGQPISGMIDFQCILRTLQLRSENRCQQYGAIFDGIPTAGFSTHGEAYLGHINQISTMLVFR